MEQQKCGVLGMLLDKIVNDIFDSSISESSFEKDSPEDDTALHSANVAVEDKPAVTINQNNSSSVSFKELETKPYNVIIIPVRNQEEFKEYFKVSQGTFEFILQFIKYDLQRKFHGKQSIPPALQLLLALRKMSSFDSYSQICVNFQVEKLTAKKAVQRVVQALSSRASKFILWPKGYRLREVCQGFQTLSGFPKIVGALNSLPIAIHNQLPDNRKDRDTLSNQSVQLQVVVDHEGRFTYCSVGSFGSIEKREVFNDSILGMFISKPEERFPDDCHVVADPDYDLHENVMVPYIGSNLTPEQENFNRHFQIAHNCVTKTIFALKSRFASLCCKLDTCSDFVSMYLTACCVLHNISVDRKDLFVNPLNISIQKFNSASPWGISVASSRALQKRDLLCNQLHTSETEGVCFV